MKKLIPLSLVLLWLWADSQAFAGEEKRSLGRSVEGAWQVVEVQGVRVDAAEDIVYINFNGLKKALSGFAGCNYINGSFRINTVKRSLKMEAVASTRTACPQLDLESDILSLLQKTASYDIESLENEGDLLILFAQDGSILLKLARMMPLDGKWTVVKVNETDLEDEDSEIFLIFNSSLKTVYGNLGCNSYHAPIEYTPQKKSLIKFGAGLTTLRLCQKMEIETQLLQAFQYVVSYKRFSARKAILCDKSGKVLIELSR